MEPIEEMHFNELSISYSKDGLDANVWSTEHMSLGSPVLTVQLSKNRWLDLDHL